MKGSTMPFRRLTILLTAFVLIALPVASVDAAKKGSSGSPGKKKNNKSKSKGGGGSSVAKVSTNLRSKFGGIAAGKLPAALIAYSAARSAIHDAETKLTRLLRDIQSQKDSNRREISNSILLARETYVQSERDYAQTMVRIRTRLRRDNEYRVLKSDLADAREALEAARKEDPSGSDAILALGEVIDLEAQMQEMEYDAMGTDQDAMQAKTDFEDAKRNYNASRRELLTSGNDYNSNRSQVKQAYEAVEDARRAAAAKGRIVQQYKSLIHTATFQRPTIGSRSTKVASGRKNNKNNNKNKKKKK